MRAIGFIPSRMASSRFFGKPLAKILGKPMIQWVYEKATKSKLLDEVIVLTDDKLIFDVVKKFDGHVLMTSKKCKSGTDRIKEVLDKFRKYDVIVNIQGDEPLVSHKDIDKAIKALLSDKECSISTVACIKKDKKLLNNPDTVKVVFDKFNHALYFSRYGIPYKRGNVKIDSFYQHIGLYVYRKKVLDDMSALTRKTLESSEKLEQLRFLENGYKIKLAFTKNTYIGIDRKKNILEVEKYLKLKG